MFKRVLISNRGEIAIRIARAAAALGVESVAVNAPADAQGLHLRVASVAREIGAGPQAAADPVRAYLDIDAMIEVFQGLLHRKGASDGSPCDTKDWRLSIPTEQATKTHS